MQRLSAISSGVIVLILAAAQFNPAWADANTDAITSQLQSMVADAAQEKDSLASREPAIEADIARIKELAVAENRLAADSDALDVRKAQVDAACPASVPEDQYSAVMARCNPLLISYNSDVNSYNQRRAAISSETTQIHDRLQKASDDEDRFKQLTSEIDQKASELVIAMEAECATSCSTKSADEGASQCMQQCFDGAHSRVAMILRPLGLQMTPNQ